MFALIRYVFGSLHNEVYLLRRTRYLYSSLAPYIQITKQGFPVLLQDIRARWVILVQQRAFTAIPQTILNTISVLIVDDCCGLLLPQPIKQHAHNMRSFNFAKYVRNKIFCFSSPDSQAKPDFGGAYGLMSSLTFTVSKAQPTGAWLVTCVVTELHLGGCRLVQEDGTGS
jgi:hypothetical protein